MAWGLVVIVGMAGGVWGLYARCPGCIDRGRVNTACAWTGDTAFVIDPANVAQREHLVADAQLAEELAIRHADAEVGMRFGVAHHGGLLEHGSFREACLARMFQEIERHHQVSAGQILVARGQRDRVFDLAVVVLFLPLYAFATLAASLWLARRFSADGRLALFVATAVASVMAAVLGLQSLQLWGAVWEVIRVGNGHMTSMRSATYTRWLQQHVDVQVLGSILLFWAIALCCYQVAHRVDERGSRVGRSGA